MFIQTESVPNPNALKFIPGIKVNDNEPIFYENIEDCKNSFLAEKLFQIDEVVSVFFGSDFITITKSDNAKWLTLKPEILVTIMDHYNSGLETFNEDITKDKDNKNLTKNKNISDIEKQIIEIIETKVRPAVASDGGDIVYIGYDSGVVKLQMKGACKGCPSSTITLKNGIESMLKHYVPEVIEVVSI